MGYRNTRKTTHIYYQINKTLLKKKELSTTTKTQQSINGKRQIFFKLDTSSWNGNGETILQTAVCYIKYAVCYIK